MYCFVCGRTYDGPAPGERDATNMVLSAKGCLDCGGIPTNGNLYPPPGPTEALPSDVVDRLQRGELWRSIWIQAWAENHAGFDAPGRDELEAAIRLRARADRTSFQYQWPRWFGHMAAMGAERPHEVEVFDGIGRTASVHDLLPEELRGFLGLPPAVVADLLCHGDPTVEAFEQAFDVAFDWSERYRGDFSKDDGHIPTMALYGLIYLGKSARHIEWLLSAAVPLLNCDAFLPQIRYFLARQVEEAVMQLICDFETLEFGDEGEWFNWHWNRNCFSEEQHRRWLALARLKPFEHLEFPPSAVLERFSDMGPCSYVNWEPAYKSLAEMYRDNDHGISEDGYGDDEDFDLDEYIDDDDFDEDLEPAWQPMDDQGRVRLPSALPSRHCPECNAEGPACGGVHVYAIELDKVVMEARGFAKNNPDYVVGQPCFYVGETAHRVECRYKQHVASDSRQNFLCPCFEEDGEPKLREYDPSKRRGKYVKEYRRRLCPTLYRHLNPVPDGDGKAAETKLAEELRARGFGVHAK